MDVNVQKQCVKVFTAEGVINMQPLLVLTQDLSGVAQQDTLVQGISDIREDISNIDIDTSTLAKQGLNPGATLTDTQQAVYTAASGVSNLREKVGTPQSGQADTLFGAIANITIDTSTIAKQGTNASATLTATQTAATNAYASAEAAKIGVVDGNDTAISVAKEIRSEVGTGSDTAAETGTLFAVLKWVKDKVKDVYNALTDGTNGLAAIKQAILDNAGTPSITIPSTTATQELAPNTLYIFAERTSNLTLTLGTPIVGVANLYTCDIIIGSTAPTITWPAGISWNGGSAPTIAADKTYQISILNNVAAYFEV